MEPREIVKDLTEHDISEYAIAKRLCSAGTPVSQSTINRIATGKTMNPSYRVVKALVALHFGIVGRRRSPRFLTPQDAA
jgi:predicted transcriptional regulator